MVPFTTHEIERQRHEAMNRYLISKGRQPIFNTEPTGRLTEIQGSKWDDFHNYPIRYTLKRFWPLILVNTAIGALIGFLVA